ncbi:hypothetical protein NHG28_06385 [Aerococcaceae bacterium NML201209]|nr:hypothetical protein [Aerococcaceae bacterium NML201209]
MGKEWMDIRVRDKNIGFVHSIKKEDVIHFIERELKEDNIEEIIIEVKKYKVR